MKSHKDLNVWKGSIDFVAEIYRITERFPRAEQFGLQAQMRRAAISIPSNISEGASRATNKEFIQFLHIALGSASELETQLIIAQKIGLLSAIDTLLLKNGEIKRMLLGLIAYLKQEIVKKTRK